MDGACGSVHEMGMRPVQIPTLVLVLAFGASADEHHWSYSGETGPHHWGETCKTGKHQSPVDIRTPRIAELPAIEFTYAPSTFRIVDNGHTVMASFEPGNFITVGGKRYDLAQLHFHHPSEERIHGRAWPMVAHLVHKDAEGKLAVVAVMLTKGKPNPAVEALWKLMPKPGPERASDGATVDPGQLLPADRAYYTFTGSLTTPPCSEDVTWFVLQHQGEVSKAEVDAFAKRYPHNARPVQPLNGRVVQASK